LGEISRENRPSMRLVAVVQLRKIKNHGLEIDKKNNGLEIDIILFSLCLHW